MDMGICNDIFMIVNISDLCRRNGGSSSDEKGIIFVVRDISDLGKIWQNRGESLRITESLEFTYVILYVNMVLSMYGDYFHSES